MKGLYPGEYFYILSLKDFKNEGNRLAFYAMDGFSKVNIDLGEHDLKDQSTYLDVIDNLFSHPEYKKISSVNGVIVLGFGETLIDLLNTTKKGLVKSFVYNFEEIKNETWPELQKHLSKDNQKLIPFSLEIKQIEHTWLMFLSPDTIKTISLPATLPGDLHSALEDFKTEFIKNIDHVCKIENDVLELIDAVEPEEVNTGLKAIGTLRDHNGIFYMENDLYGSSAFIYRLTKSKEKADLFCIRQVKSKTAISQATIKADGSFSINTLGGQQDISYLLTLIVISLITGKFSIKEELQQTIQLSEKSIPVKVYGKMKTRK